jgi:hypothetical protein
MMQTVALEAIRQAPALMREFMAPVAKVSDVKVLQINGLGGAGGDGGVPGTILGSGLAMSGALPLVREAVAGLLNNPDIQEVAGMFGNVARTALRETVSAARDGANGADQSG